MTIDRVPKVQSVCAKDNHLLIVTFNNGITKKYDVAPLLGLDVFAPLADSRLFRSVRVDHGGYGVSWNEDLDISEYELWQNGEVVVM